MAIWDAILDAFSSALHVIHGGVEPLFGVHAWGWAIIALTLIVRIFLLPLAIKQTRSMRAMQALAPKQKELQKKHKVDRDLLRKDPETYKARKAKLNEEMMALYKEEGVNPAASCLPLLAQAPIFFALYRVLFTMPELQEASFYFLTPAGASGLATLVQDAGPAGIGLALAMAATMFVSQKQMMARNPGAAEGAMAQQQKIMLYAMPVFLAFISFNLPLGVLLYWVTTNLWQMGQQAVILREVRHEIEGGGSTNGKASTAPKPSDGPDSGSRSKRAPRSKQSGTNKGVSGDGSKRKGKTSAATGDAKAKAGKSSGNGSSANRQPRRDHLPRRTER